MAHWQAALHQIENLAANVTLTPRIFMIPARYRHLGNSSDDVSLQDSVMNTTATVLQHVQLSLRMPFAPAVVDAAKKQAAKVKEWSMQVHRRWEHDHAMARHAAKAQAEMVDTWSKELSSAFHKARATTTTTMTTTEATAGAAKLDEVAAAKLEEAAAARLAAAAAKSAQPAPKAQATTTARAAER